MILVIGPGALGGLLAGLLAESGQEVVLLARSPEQAERLSRVGWTISGPEDGAVRRIELRVVGRAAGLLPESILFCVKGKDTQSAWQAVSELPGTLVVFQNGLGRADALAELCGDRRRVVHAVTSEGATLLGAGQVRHAGRGVTRAASLVASESARAARVVECLQLAGCAAEVVPDLEGVIWEKLQVNAAINALTGLLGCANGELLKNAAARELSQALAQEVAQVAIKKGINGDWSPEASRARWEGVARATAGNISSTLQDLRSGRQTEVYDINGAVAREAEGLGIVASGNAWMARLMVALEASHSTSGES